MATKRTYGDRCGIARALDLVGERWALLVVRELLLGPKRFTVLRSGLPHVSPDVLSQRLRELEESGLVRRGKLPPPAGSRIYALTERGRALEPVVLELGRFGSIAPFPPGDAQIGVDALAIALKTLYAPSATDGLPATYELRLGEDRFHIEIAGGRARGRSRALLGRTRRRSICRARRGNLLRRVQPRRTASSKSGTSCRRGCRGCRGCSGLPSR